MNVFIVFAHPETNSFNAALKDLAVTELTSLGHRVRVSDLYHMNFKAVAEYKKRLQSLQQIPDIPYHLASHYDEHHQLKIEYR